MDVQSFKPSIEEMSLLDCFEQEMASQKTEDNALQYIAGYVAYWFKHKYDFLGESTLLLPTLKDDWLCFLSRGNLIFPSVKWQEAANIMNKEFLQFHENTFRKEDKIFDKLIDLVCDKISNVFPREAIACLVRTRTYIRLRRINKEIVANNTKKKISEKNVYSYK